MIMDTYDKPKRGLESEPTQDDRLMAALAHVAVVVGFTMILPAIIWFIYRDKSPYVRFQALQAFVWQLIITAGGFVIGGCMLMAMMMSGAMADNGNGGGFACFPFAFFCGVILLGIGFTIYGIYAAIATFGGADFRYPIVGSWLENR
jgi:uncharacterized Tic20 family protein